MSTALTEKERNKLLAEMDPTTAHVAQEGIKKLQQCSQVAILVQYDLGMLVNSVYEDEKMDENQRKEEIKKLAAYWNQPNLNLAALYDYRNVAASFDREFIKEQVNERLANGSFLTWSHFKEIQKLPEKRQLAVLKQIRQHSWSANELALELQGRKEAKNKRSGGRKPSLPKTPNAMLQKLFASVQATDNYLTAVTDPLEEAVSALEPEQITEDFVENIDNTMQCCEMAQQHLKDIQARLQKMKKKSAKVATGKPKAAPVVDEDDDEFPEPAPAKHGRKQPRRSVAAVG